MLLVNELLVLLGLRFRFRFRFRFKLASFPGAEGEERERLVHTLRMRVIIGRSTW